MNRVKSLLKSYFKVDYVNLSRKVYDELYLKIDLIFNNRIVASDLRPYKYSSCYFIISTLSNEDILSIFKKYLKKNLLFDIRIIIYTKKDVLRALYVKSDDFKMYEEKNYLFQHRLQLFVD